jgi:predicted O-methyltransferase YrrM
LFGLHAVWLAQSSSIFAQSERLSNQEFYPSFCGDFQTMSSRTLNLDDTLYEYVLAHSLREHPAQTALRAATRAHRYAGMQISPEQGQFMALLIKLTGTRRAIEVGVFTGYSALTVALALPADGRLLACDISDEFTQIGKPFWAQAQAQVAHKIDLQLAPALSTLDARLAAGEAGQYDFAFIDADKPGYDAYYERCLQLLRTRQRTLIPQPCRL